ncbi:MAG: Crp/Fnr family transcriptional regulator [Acidobacteria bacterium]|nr:Crp/Fnr family transcriptional regulator [Acidobacteriota bacterium]MCA1638769.1 Crp/Fnr family transcriptional regulator [Acidobacteriota bacterium]
MPQENIPPLPDHRDCEVLTGLTVDSVPRDNSLGRVRGVRKGGSVWKPDDRSDGIFFLQSGQIAIVASDRDGRELVLGVVEAGEPFGELCFCAPKKHFLRGTYARATVKSEVLEIKLEAFLSFLQTSRDLLQAFTFTFCCRLSDCQRRVEFLAYRGAEERLGRVLLHIASTRGKPSDALAGQIVLPVSHDELAQMAAMSRPHVTVTMGKLRRRGLVNYERNKPLTVDPEALSIYLTGISSS